MSLRSNPEKMREYKRNWYHKNWKKARNSQAKYVRKLRVKVLEILGGKCVYCGCDIPEALEINHIYGGGNEEKRRGRGDKQILLDIIKGRRSTDDLELTCAICNTWHKLVKLKGLEDHWEIKWRNV